MRKNNRIRTECGSEQLEERALLSGSFASTGLEGDASGSLADDGTFTTSETEGLFHPGKFNGHSKEMKGQGNAKGHAKLTHGQGNANGHIKLQERASQVNSGEQTTTDGQSKGGNGHLKQGRVHGQGNGSLKGKAHGKKS